MAPNRTTGLPYHLGYPLVTFILLALASFTSANDLWYASATDSVTVVRFGAQNYCGYNVSNLVITAELGCVFRGWEYQIPSSDFFGFPLPSSITNNLGPVVITSLVSWIFTLVSGVHHAYVIRYSYRVSPEPDKDKLFSHTCIHLYSVAFTFLFTWVSFIIQAAVIGSATGFSSTSASAITTSSGQTANVSVSWGANPWLVLAAGVVHAAWGYEAVRWRAVQLK